MNLQYLFEIQDGLDRHIEDEHPRQEGEDRLSDKILALQVELGELANEWRGFKFWKVNPKPRILKRVDCDKCAGTGIGTNYLKNCSDCNGSGKIKINPLLEEFVDCLHFFISIAIDLGIKPNEFVVYEVYTEPTTTETFNSIFSTVSSLHVLMDTQTPASITKDDIKQTLHEAFSVFVGLGETHLGFTWEQIEQAYLEKNKVNHERQVNGY